MTGSFNKPEFIGVDGYRAGYYRAGAGAPVVFLHGGASDGRDWQPLSGVLGDEYTCLAPDFPGFGLSDHPREAYSLADYAVGPLSHICLRKKKLDILKPGFVFIYKIFSIAVTV